jgi:C1A family cysteine protease
VTALSLALLFPAIALSQPWNDKPGSTMQPVAQPSRTSSVYIGSVMALLATFEDAGILPPEGTPQANGIIKAVIQFQSAFLKSTSSRDPAILYRRPSRHSLALAPRKSKPPFVRQRLVGGYF